MSSPNPLIPQGSFQSKSSGASNVRLAVATIIAIHVVFFGGLLLQGCKRETGSNAQVETETAEPTNTDLTLPPMDTSAGGLYYTNAAALPDDTGSAVYDPNQGAASTTAVTQYQDTFTPILTNQGTQPAEVTPYNNGAGFGTPAPLETATKEYTIRRGDSFYKIAKENGITIADLQEANPNVVPTRIQPGQKIKVPAPKPSAAPAIEAANGDFISYKVKSGDTLSGLSSRYGVSVSEIRNANNLRTSRINVGQTLRIPKKQGANNPQGNAPANGGQPSNLTF